MVKFAHDKLQSSKSLMQMIFMKKRLTAQKKKRSIKTHRFGKKNKIDKYANEALKEKR